MVLTASVRREKLEQLRSDPAKAVGQQKLYYKKQSRTFGIFEIDLDYLIYNRHNGRLEAEMLTWEKEYAVSPATYDDDLHKLIDELLWRSHPSRNSRTLKDLKEKEQQRPGIVTLDGVIIDGNRRAMLLNRLGKTHFEAVILPDAYDENEKEIVRLETQYQLGEDSKLEYGALQKYLHAHRLSRHLGIDNSEIADLMGEASPNSVARLLDIMDLMNEYLDHIGCPGFYTLLKESDGATKEGMFVDLYQDLKRLKSSSPQVNWDIEPDLESIELKTIHFDHIRYGRDFTGTDKRYRKISHDGAGKKSFIAHEDVWKAFRDKHREEVDSITEDMGSLENYEATSPGFDSRVDAARARDEDWRERVHPALQRNFGISADYLEPKIEVLEPQRLLERARNYLTRIDINADGFIQATDNYTLVREINTLSYEMKKRFEKSNNCK